MPLNDNSSEGDEHSEQTVDQRARAVGLKPTVAYVPDPSCETLTSRQKRAQAKRRERDQRAAIGLRPLTIEAVPDDMREDVAKEVRRMIDAGSIRSEASAATREGSEPNAVRPMWTVLCGTVAVFAAGLIAGLLV
jgi:hypothetical protein